MKESDNRQNLLNVLPNDDVLSQCIHCGLCLAVCPTYEMTKFERSSPRGRIKLIKSVARNEMALTDTFAYEMSFCLDCQACETACPAGVKYGSMVEAARVEVANSQLNSPFNNWIKKFILNKILTSRKRLKLVSKILYFYQNSGLQKLLHSSGLFKIFSSKLSEIDKLAPKVSKEFSDEIIPEVSLPEKEVKYETALLTGCLMNVMFSDINKDTVDLLTSSGCKVFSPKDQICCGSLNAHNGELESAKEMAKQTINVFFGNNKDQETNYKQLDYIISNSAGCTAFMKEYAELLKDDTEYSEKAKIFSSKVKDILEFLSEKNVDLLLHKPEEKVTYHDACHHVHTQKIFQQPRNLLNKIPEINFNELEESTWCCGSAGIYNIIQYDSSMEVLKRKMENISDSKAETVLTANPGCISQLKYGAKKFNVNVNVMHPVSFIKGLMYEKGKDDK